MGITITDIARELNVSPATVSKALNNRKGVNSVLKLKIQRFAEEKGYKPYISARETGMYNQQLNIVGIFYPKSIAPHLIKEIQDGIGALFYKSDFYELYFPIDLYQDLSAEEKRELFLGDIIKKSNLKGIIFSFMEVSDRILNFLYKSSVPTVVLNRYTEIGRCVYIDEMETMYNVTKELISLGRENIGIIIPNNAISYIWEDRMKGYIKALKENNIKYNPNIVIYEDIFTTENMENIISRIIKINPDLDAIIFGNEVQALTGIRILKDLNKKIPDDIDVVSFDKMDFGLIVEPSLSFVEFPLFKMGESGAQLLIDSINNNDFTPKSIKLVPGIVIQKSCLKNYNEKRSIDMIKYNSEKRSRERVYI